jgi:FMN reductase
MPNIVLICGSPTRGSKSIALLQHASRFLLGKGFTTTEVSVLDFPAEDLIQARYESPVFADFQKCVAQAVGLVVATPIYKASYTGSLKTLLDILPQNALRGKTILPLATGGSLAHLLAIDYAMKPLFSVLGASDIHQGVFAVDSHFKQNATGIILDQELQVRFDESLARLAATVRLAPLPDHGSDLST